RGPCPVRGTPPGGSPRWPRARTALTPGSHELARARSGGGVGRRRRRLARGGLLARGGHAELLLEVERLAVTQGAEGGAGHRHDLLGLSAPAELAGELEEAV